MWPPKNHGFLPVTLLGLLLAISIGASLYFIFLREGGSPADTSRPSAINPAGKSQGPEESATPPAAPLPAVEVGLEAIAAKDLRQFENSSRTVTENRSEKPDQPSTPVAGLELESSPRNSPGQLPTPAAAGELAGAPPPASQSNYPVDQPQAVASPADQSNLPLVAIVIDDMGYDRLSGERLLALDLDLTFSFLPHAPHTPALSRLALENGRNVLLHLPLEPIDTSRFDPGPGALYLSMPLEELHRNLQENLTAVPMAIGVNNHMGSRFTADHQAMASVMALLRPRGLFFLDSLTIAGSSGYQVAREFGMAAARRDLFLDNDRSAEKIAQQLTALINLARKKGSAVAIAHPHPDMITALQAQQEQLRTAVKVVGIQNLVH